MPRFLADVIKAFFDVLRDARQMWDTTPTTTRVLLALAMSGFGVYLGARSEHSSVSAAYFFIAFGFFAYVVMIGMSMIQ